ncbi:MAG: hypothetical protein ACKOZT_06675 [Cyanobium sp.]
MSSDTPAPDSQPDALQAVDSDPALVAALAAASRGFDATGADAERNCWMAVHAHIHGQPPSEYDIREVPEDLYLAVLQQRRREDQLQP